MITAPLQSHHELWKFCKYKDTSVPLKSQLLQKNPVGQKTSCFAICKWDERGNQSLFWNGEQQFARGQLQRPGPAPDVLKAELICFQEPQTPQAFKRKMLESWCLKWKSQNWLLTPVSGTDRSRCYRGVRTRICMLNCKYSTNGKFGVVSVLPRGRIKYTLEGQFYQ